MSKYIISLGVALLAAGILLGGCAIIAAGAVGGAVVAHHDYCKTHHCNW
jgi:hypothetical protein